MRSPERESQETDNLKLYVQNGGTLVATFNTGLVNQYHIAPDKGYPCELTDLFGLEVLEFDALPPGQENHLTFKGAFTTSQMHPARMWCDIIEPKGCQILANYAKDFYAGRPAMTVNTFGLGRAIYLGTMSHQHFYHCDPGCVAAPNLQPASAAESARKHRGQHAPEGRHAHFLPDQPPEFPHPHPILQTHARFPERSHVFRQL